MLGTFNGCGGTRSRQWHPTFGAAAPIFFQRIQSSQARGRSNRAHSSAGLAGKKIPRVRPERGAGEPTLCRARTLSHLLFRCPVADPEGKALGWPEGA